MSKQVFFVLTAVLGIGFGVAFSVVVIPPLMASGDIVGAALAGFVNPYASGYATDAIMTWCVLAVWVVYDASRYGIRYGWIALLIGVAPGVASGFALYLILRTVQLGDREQA